jgi:F-type H+-transporting ATPase subunit delta
MRKDPKSRRLAERLVELSRDGDGRFSGERVGEILAALRDKPPPRHRLVLRMYAFLLERAWAGETVQVEAGAEASAEAIEALRDSLSEKTGRSLGLSTTTNPALIAGLRARLGDDVYEISIPSRLAGLA